MEKDLSKYFTLLIRLAEKDLKVRYKSTLLGFVWALLVPIATMLIFQVVFSFFLRVKIPNVPYSVYLLSGLFPWFFFSNSISAATTSLVDNSNLLKKVYFTRTLIPDSIVAANLINFLLSMLVLLIYMIIIKMSINISIIFLPVVILFLVFTISGISLISAGLFVKYRDIKYIVEILLLVWFYATPIFYSVELARKLPGLAYQLYMFNPMTCIIIMLRDILIYTKFPSGVILYKTLFLTGFIYILGRILFKKYQKNFADLV